jgi:LysM domain-containing protein
MRTLIAAMLVASTTWAQGAQAPNKAVPQQGPPPKNLTVRPDGHVSANQDPANPEKFEVHVVKQGETLSGIAGEVLKNPRLWPQLWEQNEHIINPHWIYPNDKILIQPVVEVSQAKPPEPEPVPEPAPEPPPRRTQLPPPPQPPQPSRPAPPAFVVEPQKPVAEIKYDDLYCSGTVRTTHLPEDLKVISKFDATGAVLATDTEYVYLSQGSEDGMRAGNVYQVMRPTKTLTNPYGRSKNDRNLGTHYLDVGQIRVVLVQPDYSLARVLHNCGDAVEVGDFLLPFQRLVVPAPSRPRPFSPTMTTTSGIHGMIVTTKNVLLNFGSSFKGSGTLAGAHEGRLEPLERGVASSGSIVYIDIGQDAAVNPGDVFIVYRDVEIDNNLYSLPREAKKLRSARQAVGELLVLKVGERAATALVTYSTDGLVLGDQVERR